MKKCLITIVSAIFIAAVTHAQEPSEDLTAEQQQLAQRKAELDAREKALDKREKMLAAKERATANSTPRSHEKEKAKVRHEQAQITEEQAKAARAEKKLHEPFFQRLDEAFLEQLGTLAYVPPDPNAPNPRRIPPAPFDSPPFPSADWQIGGTQIIGDPGELPPYPLMQAIYEGPGGQAWKDSKVQIYGWVNFSGKHQHFASLKDEPKRKFSVDLRFTPQPDGVESDCSLPRAVGERKSNGPHRLGFSNLSALRARLPIHDHLRVSQRPTVEAQQLLRFRHADDLSRRLCPADFPGHEHSDRPHYLRARHRGAARAEQSDGEPFAALWLRQLLPGRNLHDDEN